MQTPILTTKLYIPPPRPNLVHRPSLLERLHNGLHRKLTLISAPAGFGKTTLVSAWVSDFGFTNDDLRLDTAQDDQSVNQKSNRVNRVAWLSLEEGDNELTRFLIYFVAALQMLPVAEDSTRIGDGAMELLQSPQPPPSEIVLTTLLNEISTLPGKAILVLDDYHLIDAQPIDDLLLFLLDHLPPQMHLAITTREEPKLPLARLRTRGQLTEIRATDLRFTAAEATEFLNQMMGLGLAAEAITMLETRTEGWIAGLQMAALSMQGRTDAAGFIQAFSGSHRFVLDYLVEEVLQGQPEDVHSFLLQTSILDRLSGPLCDAVMGREDGKRILETLERSNLFVIPLDDQRQWYRYHHLFAEVLQTHLLEEQPAQVDDLHRRASEWYEQQSLPSDAIHHALAAADFERAADLLELARPVMSSNLQFATWLRWVKALPDELVHARPVLVVGYAWALLSSGQLEAATPWLDATTELHERLASSKSEIKFRDEIQLQTLPASIATARAYHALALGDIPNTVTYARQALDLAPEEDYQWSNAAASLLGLAQYMNGKLDAAYQAIATVIAGYQRAGNVRDALGPTFILADIRTAQGRLHDAFNLYQQALQLAMGQGKPAPPEVVDIYRGIGELHYEWGDLEAATQQFQMCVAANEQARFPYGQYRHSLIQARIKAAQGDLNGALDLLDEAEQLYYRSPVPDVRPVAALRTLIWVAQGRLSEALNWVRTQGLSVDDDLYYPREFEHITLAKVLIAHYQHEQVERSIDEAMNLLARLLQAAEAGGRMGNVIEILLQQALADAARSDTPAALVALERALTLAEPARYVRLFVDEGPPLAALLHEAAKQGIAPRYVQQLRAAFGESAENLSVPQPSLAAQTSMPSLAAQTSIIEPLSDRERDVLRLLATDLSGPEIARELTVSLNTMRTHTKNIYSKLGVNSRRAAVRRAQELQLL